jgi:pimeloyl-ACP methyl ester carboxylesterase
MPPHVPTVILAHDWGLTRSSWDRVVERVVPAGIRVVTWDQRGHGNSTLGLNRGALEDLTIDELGRDLHAVIRTVVPPSSPVVLVGHSLGGMTVMSYVAQSLNEARARVAGAVLVSTAAVDVRLGQPAKGRLMKMWPRSGADGDDTPLRGGNVRDVLFGRDPDPDAVAAVREQISATDPAVLRAAYRAFGGADVRKSFELFMQLPVSILVGAQDRVTPPTRSRAMTITLTQARYAAVAGAGHELPYEAPERIIAEVRWVLESLRATMRVRAQRNAQPAARDADARTGHSAPPESA